MSAPMRLTAGAPVPKLMDALARASWGLLAPRAFQGVRAVLTALGRMARPNTGDISHVTCVQVADFAGRSERRTREVLHWLEDLGLIEYRRGFVQNGLPRPGQIRIVKAQVVELIRVSREAKDQVQRDRQTRFRLRMAELGSPANFKNRNRRSITPNRADMKTALPPYQGKASAPSQRRASTQPKKGNPMSCPHHAKDPANCHSCKATAAYLDQGKAARKREEDKALLRAYAAAHWPGRRFDEVRNMAIAAWKGGTVHEWQAEQMRAGLLRELTNA